MERTAVAPLVKEADAVILSALVPGELAPVIVTEEMVLSMKPGSVIVDVSVDQGGNCALTRPGSETLIHDVYLCGVQNIPGRMAVHATWLYAANIYHYVENLFKQGIGTIDWDDEIVKNSLVTRGGELLFEGALKAMGMEPGLTSSGEAKGLRHG